VSQLPQPVAFTVGFMLLFSIVIALFKDIPDAKASGILDVWEAPRDVSRE
jgi:hypothetical protein